MRPKIYCFINGGKGTEWLNVIALAEDGHCLAGHISSDENWARHDIGVTSVWKHKGYVRHYPQGYEVEWIDEPTSHAGVQAAIAKNRALGEAVKEAKDVA